MTKGAGSTLLVISRGAMELVWRYAWALFLICLSMRIIFPLFTAACMLAVSAVLNMAPAKWGWRMYRVVLLNITGFLVCALLFLHHSLYPAYPFWSLQWVGRLVGDPGGLVEWFCLLVTFYGLILIWQGGWYLKKHPGDYLAMCLQFDKGLGLLFGLLIVNAVFQTRAGIGMPANSLGFLMPAYMIFGLSSIGFSRHQHDVRKSFLSGYRGLGIICSIAAMAILSGSGLIFLFHPYLFPAADALLTALDRTTMPMVPYLVRFLRYILVPKYRMNPSAGIENNAGAPNELIPPPTDGWLPVLANILVWLTIVVVVVMVAGLILYLLKRLFAWLLSKDALDSPSPSFKAWAMNLLKVVLTTPAYLWRYFMSLFKRVDSAAMVYTCLLQWGRHCGLSKRRNETPGEYGSRLVRFFPNLSHDIRLIVEAFEREIYGRVQPGPGRLGDIRRAQRRMKRIRYWPLRVKVWLVS